MNYLCKKPRNFSIFSIILILILGSFIGFISTAAADPTVEFVESKLTDNKETIVVNGEPTIDLVVTVVISTDTAGGYVIFGDMLPHSKINSQATTYSPLKVGENTVKLQFPGNDIYNSQKDGNYIIFISVESNGVELDTLKYVTKQTYNHNDFKSENDMTDYSIGLVSNTVKLQTDVFTAVIFEYTPVIEYYYSIDNGETAKFKVTYTNLFGYNDLNSDGIYNPIDDEIIYTADLTNANWYSNKVLFENFESFDFEITGTVTMKSAKNPDVDVTISFHYSSSSYTTNTQRKFDIEISLPEGQMLNGIDAIAIEHMIEDESAGRTHTFDFDSGSSIVRFMNNDGLQHGFYSWIPTADTNVKDGVVVGSSAISTPEGMVLYLSYSYDETIIWYYHDPEIGIDPGNIKIKVLDAAEEILHYPGLFIVSSLVAAVVVAGSLYRQRKK